MLRVYGCIADQHDLRLVLLAAAICLLSSYTALSVFARARATETRRRWGWLALTPVVFGAGVWTTHFVAMLALQPGFAVGYDLTATGISIVVGMAIAAMHYIGMHSLRVPAVLVWELDLVVASLAIGIVFGAAAFWVYSR